MYIYIRIGYLQMLLEIGLLKIKTKNKNQAKKKTKKKKKTSKFHKSGLSQFLQQKM